MRPYENIYLNNKNSYSLADYLIKLSLRVNEVKKSKEYNVKKHGKRTSWR